MQTDTILIGSKGLGAGNDELGGLILANFLRLLAERDDRPNYIVLWNEGVKLAVEDSIWLEHLKRLQDLGATIISCLTCIEYFGLEGKIVIGEIRGMSQIQEILFSSRVLTV